MSDRSGETWRPAYGFEDYYEVSDHGRVRSLDRALVDSAGRLRNFRGTLLSAKALTQGYPVVTLKAEGRQRTYRVHRLVALSFLPPPGPDQTDVCHNDGDRTNSRLENLRWDTHRNNQLDMLKHGTSNFANRPRGTHCSSGHELTKDNTYVSPEGYRSCRTCMRAWRRAWRANNLEAARAYDRAWKQARRALMGQSAE